MELLEIPEGYSVLFLGGGASLEFCMVPYNFLKKKAAYLNTGVWAKKAMKEAKLFGEVPREAIDAAASLEMLHNASLIHDDVVDESQKRRGLPTINHLYDNRIAVLVGD